MTPEPPTILIVDDEEPIRRLVERVFQRAGYVTAVASDGPDALRVATTLKSLDLLVTDLMMPEMTGDELARRLRESHRRLKVLYFTGDSKRLFEEKRTMLDGEALLEKPCSPKGLLEAISLLTNETRRIGDIYVHQANQDLAVR